MRVSSWKNKRDITLSIIIILLLWEIVALKMNNDIYLPAIEKVLIEIKNIAMNKNFFITIYSTVSRTILSFCLALVLSIILGVVSALNKTIYNFLVPINVLSKSIPTMVLVVIAIIWFEKDMAPLVVGTAIVFPIIYNSIVQSILNIDKNIIEMCSIYNISKFTMIKKVYIRVIIFNLLTIFSSSLSLAFKVVIAGEVHGQPTYGIGAMVQLEKMNFNTSAIFAWVIVIAVISLIFDLLQKVINSYALKWKA